MSELHCPYCDESLGSSIDDCHEQDVEYEYQCPKCDKDFIFRIDYDPSFTSDKLEEKKGCNPVNR
jgi:DNA-directed RNA polymerase subunit RPC12/RpoP